MRTVKLLPYRKDMTRKYLAIQITNDFNKLNLMLEEYHYI